MPNAMALVGEFSTPAHRVKRMMLVSCGFTLGAALGGFISAALIPAYGWRAVFFLAGLPGLLFGVLAFLTLKDPGRGHFDTAVPPVMDREPFHRTLRQVARQRSILYAIFATTIGAMMVNAFMAWTISLT